MSYLSRLRQDLDRWIEAGWVGAENRSDILADASQNARQWSAAGALAILGAILLAAAALSFVAANWADLPRILRIAIILAALWAAQLGAGRALDHGQPALGHALALLGTALFGVAIFLTAQTFNMTSFRLTALLIWAVAALAMAWMLRSRPVLILSTVIGAIWVAGETENPAAPEIILEYAVLWSVTLAAAARLRSIVCANLLAVAALIWLHHAAWVLIGAADDGFLAFMAAGSLFAGALAMSAASLRDRGVFGMGALTGWAASYALALGWFLQIPFFNARDIAAGDLPAFSVLALIALAVLISSAGLRLAAGTLRWTNAIALVGAAVIVAIVPTLYTLSSAGLAAQIMAGLAVYAVAIALILHGAGDGRRFIGALGVITFIAETLYIYGETLGGLLDTSLLFFLGGILLIGLSTALLRWRKFAAPSETASSEPTQSDPGGETS